MQEGDNQSIIIPVNNQSFSRLKSSILQTNEEQGREKWSRDIEFLFSCIALSVGLGNVWRFPFIALRNGGGAFVIPYIVVLLLVGRPIYYMEAIVGQFSSRGCLKAFEMVPLMKGVVVVVVVHSFESNEFKFQLNIMHQNVCKDVCRYRLWTDLCHRFGHHLLCQCDGSNNSLSVGLIGIRSAMDLLS